MAIQVKKQELLNSFPVVVSSYIEDAYYLLYRDSRVFKIEDDNHIYISDGYHLSNSVTGLSLIFTTGIEPVTNLRLGLMKETEIRDFVRKLNNQAKAYCSKYDYDGRNHNMLINKLINFIYDEIE